MQRQPTREEAERQVAEAVERHHEALASLAQGARSTAGEASAAGSVARSVQLVAYALRRAAAAGVAAERLVAVAGWDADVVAAALDPAAAAVIAEEETVGRAPEADDALARLQELLRRIAADVNASDWSPAPADLDDLRDRLDSQWRAWRDGLGRRP